MKFVLPSKNSSGIKEQLDQLKESTKEASRFIKEIEKGNLEVDISEKLVQSELGTALLSIKNHLTKIAKEERERNWLNIGLAKFSDILRNKKSLDLKELTDDILANLVKYTGANQGAIFVLEDSVKGNEYLQMLSCYAYDRKKYINKQIGLGEGLVGQCVLEKEIIYLTEAPPDYVKITSGLGHSTPRSILISPLSINENIFGVLELASFEEFSQYKIDFINRLSENIAASIKNVKESERIIALLNSSQQQAEELRAQEEEMRQNMEELQATQEEMQRKNNEIMRASAEMQSIFNGINATMATIEFTPNGTILTANINFLKTFKYTLEEIKGKHHRKFVPREILESEDYKTFWNRLANGDSFNGVFRRIASDGKTVWLNAIYNPILDANGNVIKIVKFAIDITTQQELIAESDGILSGINATMATIEFTPDGTVLSANDNFLKLIKYSINEISGKHHSQFVPMEILETEDYKKFWKKLAAGESISGVFKRIDSEGKTIWLNAIYNPIRNANGDVIKVVKFATDVTATQSLLDTSSSI